MQRKAEHQKSPEEKYVLADNYLKCYSHSSKKLHKAIIDALPALKNGKAYNPKAIDLAIMAGKIMDMLAEASRAWNISIHWLYMVCNPKIEKPTNVKYSPIYKRYATDLPLNRFGELDRLVKEKDGSYVRIGDKLVGDSRFVGKGCEDFGTAWNNDGEVIKRDKNNHPILDGFVGLIAEYVNNLMEICCRNPKRDRHVLAFMIAHTRDDQLNKMDSSVVHKDAHLHLVIDMSTRRTRYQMMELMGYNFNDLTETFKWIKKMDKKEERIAAFLGTLQGAMQNFVVTKDYVASLQYLVHQTKKAKRDQKTPYAIDEVISWLPDDPGKNYSSIAGVYDDEMVADGINNEVIRNLHSPYNLRHHMARLVGRNEGDRVFTYHQLTVLRSLGSKGSGSMAFTKRSKKMILDQLMEWIYQGKMEVNDWKNAIHGAFSDTDAAELLADRKFIQKLEDTLNDQRESTISDVDADRDMTTIFVSAETGGIGKSYLASRLCQYVQKGRTAYMTAAEDKNKTVDYWQDYQDQGAAIIDEVSASSIEWSALKDMLDPHKIPRVSSRFHNACPWNVHLLVLTNVYADGVAGYVRDTLHYAPGVTKLGYLKQDENDRHNWLMKSHDPKAGQIYLSQLSQLLRRLPINIHMKATNDGKGTQIAVLMINFRPGGRSLQNYDYVYTKDSVHTFNAVINDDLPEEKLDKIVKTVIRMIRNIKQKAQAVFKNNPNAVLDQSNGFINAHRNFGYYLKNEKPILYDEIDGNNSISHEKVNMCVSPSVDENLLTKLHYLRYKLWPEIDPTETNFDPDIDQVTALLQGKTVPLQRNKDDWTILQLSLKGFEMAKSGQVLPIIMRLNEVTSINKSDDLFVLGQSDKIQCILPNSSWKENN
ncbi:P-loop NTPase family protein [Limosilactobacillus reuteri]|uniref:Helicase superfamily 3 single-stranded DNA/RNA virus domain-containing protein n=1 Tax=Limosilactobacillus reuteri subsp. rodentium (strain DSM 17509 / CIP 109821 / 100-23) TaxID=349123 RepID=B3XP06_LIMR1|nr:hypothetical protein [Limosilactobacillus reuteri]EDX43542.1 hypothetical protein Lreu23DRAFT_5064 [Limosilactobacillus reuteri subsp. rodentium]MCC4475049.1 hypothetical protein [Limosilactobacillus reuteri]